MMNNPPKKSARSRIERIRDEIRRQRAMDISYSEIATFFGISKGTTWRILNQNYEPKSSDIRKQLGLSEIIILHAYRNDGGRFKEDN